MTRIDAVAVPVLKAVVPPLLRTLTLAPADPVVWSQALNLKLAIVPFSESGTNRRRSVSRSSTAAEVETVPTDVHDLPPSSEYCQIPFPLFRDVMAMPAASRLFASVIGLVPALARISATVFPVLDEASSVIAARVKPTLVSNTGASLT